ncbi:Flagellar motor switch protein FliN [hydrothermal vent metagenome]|uniref:Flagellar motor switch protein FliN n=1 Tax=hydrothermal vent metagenome TaxID=652676 RepID=A0A3B0TQ69_9ZZZZ
MSDDNEAIPETNQSAPGEAEAVPLQEMQAPEPNFPEPVVDKSAADLEAIFDVPVRISVILGRTRIPVADLLKMDVGTVVELDRQVGEAIDVYINDRLIARGEIVLVENRLGVTMTEIIKAA